MPNTIDVKDAADATVAVHTLDNVNSRIGEVQASPTQYTLLERLKVIATALAGTLTVFSARGVNARLFAVDFATLTRPANTTAYTAGDSVSDNATAGSVTALVSGDLSDTNDEPIFVSQIRLRSSDTGVAGRTFRAHLFNSNPTSSSGVVGGDNSAYSQKMAGWVGSFIGTFATGFSDGSVAILYPEAGVPLIVNPVTGAKTLYIQYQSVDGFTPSANSTTFIGRALGVQGRLT